MIFFPTVNFLILPCVAYAQFDWQTNTPLPLPALSPIAAASTIVDNDHQKKRPCSQETAFANILPISLDNSTPIFLSQETDPPKNPILWKNCIYIPRLPARLSQSNAQARESKEKKGHMNLDSCVPSLFLFPYACTILLKSATSRRRQSMLFKRLRRFWRTAASSAMTMTASKKALIGSARSLKSSIMPT